MVDYALYANLTLSRDELLAVTSILKVALDGETPSSVLFPTVRADHRDRLTELFEAARTAQLKLNREVALIRVRCRGVDHMMPGGGSAPEGRATAARTEGGVR